MLKHYSLEVPPTLLASASPEPRRPYILSAFARGLVTPLSNNSTVHVAYHWKTYFSFISYSCLAQRDALNERNLAQTTTPAMNVHWLTRT